MSWILMHEPAAIAIRCGKFIAPDEYCELYVGHEKPCGLMPEHEHWFDRNGYCKTCGLDGGPEVCGG